MDDILQRLIVVERQAEEKIREAEKLADDIARQARQKSEALQQAFTRKMAEEAAALIAARVDEAEQQKRQALEAAAIEIRRQRETLSVGTERAVEHAVRRLSAPSVQYQ